MIALGVPRLAGDVGLGQLGVEAGVLADAGDGDVVGVGVDRVRDEEPVRPMAADDRRHACGAPRSCAEPRVWLRFAFWGMNAGLFIMCVGSLLPVGLAQTWASVEHGYWYARSTEFLGLPYMQTLRWLRVPGDTLFAVAALVLVSFVFAGRSGSATRVEEPLPGGVRVPAGD